MEEGKGEFHPSSLEKPPEWKKIIKGDREALLFLERRWRFSLL
jgi:hypothetical protein